jgi:tRNA A-37 threonylcarbamoyl transferase component Bud32
MVPHDGASLLDHIILLGLINREQAREVKAEAEDRELDSTARVLLRKGMLTSWQLERAKKGDQAGFFFGGCKVLFHLAEGTFARVYRGMRNETGEPVAVKVLRRRFSSDPEAIARFNKEAQEGMKLRHQNIVQILEYGEQDRNHFMIMEYVEGSNLRDLLRIRHRIDPVVGLPMMIGLARGLKYSQDLGVTHRDIKGSNILVSSNGEAKLVDFGLATIEGDGKKAASVNPRTVDYSALERTCNSEKGDPRSDIFFLGCVYYQLLTGQLAMPETETKDQLAKMLKRSFSAIKPLSEQRYAPDPELCAIIEKMMKVDLKLRYQKIDEVIADLEAYQKHQSAGWSASEDTGALDEDDIFMKTVAAEVRPTPTPQSAAVAVAEGEGDGDGEMGPGRNGTAVAEAEAVSASRDVLCVESQGEVQEAFRKALSKLGYRVSLAADPASAARQYREQPPGALIYDADGLGPNAVNAFLELHENARGQGRDLAALVLLSPKQLALKEKLPVADRLLVLSKPLKMKQILDAIGQLLPVAPGE